MAGRDRRQPRCGCPCYLPLRPVAVPETCGPVRVPGRDGVRVRGRKGARVRRHDRARDTGAAAPACIFYPWSSPDEKLSLGNFVENLAHRLFFARARCRYRCRYRRRAFDNGNGNGLGSESGALLVGINRIWHPGGRVERIKKRGRLTPPPLCVVSPASYFVLESPSTNSAGIAGMRMGSWVRLSTVDA